MSFSLGSRGVRLDLPQLSNLSLQSLKGFPYLRKALCRILRLQNRNRDTARGALDEKQPKASASDARLFQFERTSVAMPAL